MIDVVSDKWKTLSQCLDFGSTEHGWFFAEDWDRLKTTEFIT